MPQRQLLVGGIFVFILALSACSTDEYSAPDPQTIDFQAESPTPTLESIEYQEDTSTEKQENQEFSEVGQKELWLLTATYRWIGTKTPTDIPYTYQTLFELSGDNNAKVIELDSTGFTVGQAGINYDGECIEAQPVTIEWNYKFKAKLFLEDADSVESTFGEEGIENLESGKVRMIEVSFTKPEITLFEIETFACGPDMDPEFIKSLNTYWITTIGDYPSVVDRAFPVSEGVYCFLPLDYSDEGLGSLYPCYKMERYVSE